MANEASVAEAGVPAERFDFTDRIDQISHISVLNYALIRRSRDRQMSR